METKVILDTTVLVDFIRNNEDAVSFVKNLSEKHEICTTDINVFELYYGAYLSKQTDKNVAAVKGIINTLIVFSTTEESMEISAKLLADLDKKGQKIEIKDVLVAGICLLNSCPIATQNKKHFERMGVKIIG
ncbi:MAG: type II toxin-antitoxin system VapC family toxin [Candidatus Aenigmarchaeota archaeon]|nr:type II toxin-antitoxin system VapC family toxin [Candidatus Aenigmarchaeota archaeon]